MKCRKRILHLQCCIVVNRVWWRELQWSVWGYSEWVALFRMNWWVAVGGAESEGRKLRGLFCFVLAGDCWYEGKVLSCVVYQAEFWLYLITFLVYYYRNRHSTHSLLVLSVFFFYIFILLYHICLSACVQHLLLSNWNSTYTQSITAKCSPFTLFKNINVLLIS